jgi:hypothetical protein
MFTFTLLGWLISRKNEEDTKGWQDVEKLKPSCIADGIVKWGSQFRKQHGSTSKI